MMKQRLMVLMSVGMLLSGVLSACGTTQKSASTAPSADGSSKTAASPSSGDSTGNAANKAEPKHLTMSMNWSSAELTKAMTGILDAYNAKHPDVVWTLEPGMQEDKLLAQIAAGNPPSVSMLGTTNYVPTFAAKGAILPLEPYIQKSGLNMDQFTPASLYSNSILGSQYALPYFEDTYGLYYNKTLFAKAGIDHPPATLEELMDDAKKLTVEGQDGQYTQLGFLPSFTKESEGYLWGGRWATKDGAVTANDPATVKGVSWLVDFWHQFDADKIARFNSSNQNAASGINPFTTGKVGMIISGEWFMPSIQQQAPNLDYGVAPIPHPADSAQTGNIGSVGGNPLVIPKGAKEPDQAWELIQWLATEGEKMGVQPEYFSAIMAVPALKELVNDPKLAPNPQMAFFWKYSGGENIIPFPPIPESTTYAKLLSTNIQQAELGKMTVQKALDDVQKQIAPMVETELKTWKASGGK